MGSNNLSVGWLLPLPNAVAMWGGARWIWAPSTYEACMGLKYLVEHSSLETWFWFQWILTTPFDQDFGVLRYEVHIGHILCKNHEIWQPWHPFFEKILNFFRCYWYLGKNTQQNHVLNFLPISLFKMVSYDHKNDCQPWKIFKIFFCLKIFYKPYLIVEMQELMGIRPLSA